MNALQSEVDEVILRAASRTVEMKPGDYTDEAGIIHCGKCKEPKQYIIANFCGTSENHLVPCMCECEKKDYEEQQFKLAESRRMSRIKSLRVSGIQDAVMRKARFEDADDSIYIRKCKQYVSRWDELYDSNSGMIFCGDVGCGKTFAASCIANALIDRGIPVLMTSFPKILNSGFDKTEIITQMRNYDLVIIDDLGAERQNEYALETVFFTIDERYKSGKPMIITTNLRLYDLKNPKCMEYRRIYDRVLEMCMPMVFKESSRRIAKAQDKAARVKAIMTEITNTEE